MEDKKQVGLIVTAVTVVLCGCPGLCLLVFGGIMAAGGSAPADIVDTTGNPLAVGIAFLCLGLLMAALPIGAGIYTFLQSQKEKELVEDDEITEIPPAI
jgi:hypothetical protein